MKKTIVSPSFIKQQAQKIKKEKLISQSKALDEAVKPFGFTNYINYLNTLKSNKVEPKPATPEQIDQVYFEKMEIAHKEMKTIFEVLEKIDLPMDAILKSLKTKKTKKAVQSFCEETSDLKKYLELYLLQDFLHDEEGEIEDFTPYHIAKNVRLKNLSYSFANNEIVVEGEYDLTLKFAFNFDKDAKHEIFNDQDMSGSFELRIDKNKEVFFEHQDIGYHW